jgi:hypothetical protein
MRTLTGQTALASTTHLTPQPDAPSLPLLVSRIAAARGLNGADCEPRWRPAVVRDPLTLIVPSPGLVTTPPSSRLLEVSSASLAGSASVALLAAHGGAGVSCLLRAGLTAAGGVDASRAWPADGRVLLVARTSTGGLESARDAARQHAAGAAGVAVDLVGLVLIADAPGRLPARTAALADLVSGAFDRVWLLPWLEEWRLAALTEPLPTHPEVTRLSKDLRALTGARTSPEGDLR